MIALIVFRKIIFNDRCGARPLQNRLESRLCYSHQFNLRLDNLCRQTNGEGGPHPQFTLGRNIPTQHFAEALGNLQSQPGSTILAGHRSLGLQERLKQFLHLLGGHAYPGVAYAEGDPIGAVHCLPGRIQPDRSMLGELASVAEQVDQSLAYLNTIGTHGAEIIGTKNFKIVGVIFNQRLDGAHHILD